MTEETNDLEYTGSSSAVSGDRWLLPRLGLLEAGTNPASDKAALERTAQRLETVLADFHVKGAVVHVCPGPAITTYEVEPAPGVSLARLVRLEADLARNMATMSAKVVRIPGRTVIGVELPNAQRDAIGLREFIGSQAFEDQTGALPVIFGKSVTGAPIIADLAPMAHLLVAGTTGSGKSVGLNCMILSLLYRLTPDQCRLILIDPKLLELSAYDGIPHLLAPAISDPAKALKAFEWAVEHMEERYRVFALRGALNLADFNNAVLGARNGAEIANSDVPNSADSIGRPLGEANRHSLLPRIVIVIDELAELMGGGSKDIEFNLRRLAKSGGDAGIHMILASDRPSIDIVSDAIKANLKHRISYRVVTDPESRIALGEAGAEQLVHKGDMLYRASGQMMIHVHGAMVSDDEVRAVADHWRSQAPPDSIQPVAFNTSDAITAYESAGDMQYRAAIQFVVESQKASTSWLQRQLRLGYNATARLMERMEKDGIVSPPDSLGRRSVLRDRDGNPQSFEPTPPHRGILSRLFGA